MARTGQRRSSARTRTIDNEGLIPVLARAVREIEQAAQRGKLKPVNRTKFQVIAVLMREERTHAKDPATPLSDPERAETLKRLDGIASILARTAARDTSVLPLLDPDAKLSETARAMRKHMLFDGGVEMVVEEEPEPEPEDPALAKLHERQVVPPSVKARVLANPFLEPDLDRPAPAAPPTRLLANWELLGPLFKSFEYGAGGGIASMDLPRARASTASRRRTSSSCATRRASSRACASATASSCSPTSRASARPRRRCSPRPSPTPTRCSSWCRTS
ncbi:hypothetical protein BC477_01360 [Clavibacter michiganensis subsp. michiganensis]|uniref:Uncharacterized protein n=1 Tax=Clavibacter michiganensis subsp. michiganensis TaxID=33013 RepID=A0A251XIG0_CLAMM|nr:hypothetical protein BC477_01360 [Clavibacter michiganensis subsp. michiganensis]OUE03354.1 hypothetical protein CMMCAS07_00295 [Clavibacter michiganensis subsp. michiganensis]